MERSQLAISLVKGTEEGSIDLGHARSEYVLLLQLGVHRRAHLGVTDSCQAKGSFRSLLNEESGGSTKQRRGTPFGSAKS
jgi:hypothetical protein